MQNLAAGVTTLIYLLGLLGSILIWTGARTGLWLSVFHQLLIIPVFFIPGVFYWVAGDVVSAVTAAVLHGNGDLTFGASLSFNSASPLTAFKAAADASYFGVDLFALICVGLSEPAATGRDLAARRITGGC